MKLFYSEDYVAAAESFDTTRKSGWIAESLSVSPIEGVEIVAPRPLEFDEIASVHDSEYVAAVQSGEPRNLAESQGFMWDYGMWTAVRASTGGIVSATMAAMSDGASGSLSGGLHHARRDMGAGYCTFNGLAIAAKAALTQRAETVLILDVDAHCGGGTHSLIEDEARIRQIDVSVSSFDSYHASDPNTLDIVHSPDTYLSTIESRLSELEQSEWRPSVCIYNSGMDPDQRCGTGGMRGIDSAMLGKREELVFDWFKSRSIPIAFVIAGGYFGGLLSQDDLVALHRLTIRRCAASFLVAGAW